MLKLNKSCWIAWDSIYIFIIGSAPCCVAGKLQPQEETQDRSGWGLSAMWGDITLTLLNFIRVLGESGCYTLGWFCCPNKWKISEQHLSAFLQETSHMVQQWCDRTQSVNPLKMVIVPLTRKSGIITYLLTYSLEQSPLWEANRFSARQEIPSISWNLNVHYHIHKCKSVWTFHNKISLFSEDLLVPCPYPKLEYHTFLAVRDCLFSIFTATLHIGGRSSIHNLRIRHAIVTGTRL